MPPLPARRPGQSASLGDHEARIRAIERQPPTTSADVITDLNSAEEYVKDAGTTITFMTSADLSLSHDAGESLLDYSTPDQPEVLTGGVYAISVSIVVADAAVTVNHYVLTLSVTQVLLATQGFHQDSYSSALGDAIAASVSWTGIFSAGDSFIVRVLNLDSVDREFFPVEIAVTRILEI